MQKLCTLALLVILGVTGLSHSQDIPDGVKKYMYQLQHDPAVVYGFDESKKWRFIDQSVQFQDWYVGLPFQFCDLNIEKIEKATIDTKFEDLIEPTNRWCIPIKINNGSYVYHVLVTVENDGFRPSGCGEDVIGFNTWDKVRKEFPEESGIRPIFIDYPFQLLYFPHQKNSKNIFHARNPKWNDSMSKVTSKSLGNLDDGKTIVPHLKNLVKAYKGQQNASDLQKGITNPTGNSSDTSGGSK